MVSNDRDKNRVADEVAEFTPSLKFTVPNGVAFSPDGFLYVCEHNRILVFQLLNTFWRSRHSCFHRSWTRWFNPCFRRSYNHGARVCKIGPDGKLYVSLGQPYNVSPQEKIALYDETGIGGILKMDTNGQNREVYVLGARNPGGMDLINYRWSLVEWQPGWWLGDTIPPGETNIATESGQHFGFPWFGGGQTRTNEYKDDTPPSGIVHPVMEHDAHAADMGAVFYTEKCSQSYQEGYFWRSMVLGIELIL